MNPKTLTLLRVLAVLIAFRGIGNALKRFGTGSGQVFFGYLLPQDSLVAPALGALMILYAYGLWTLQGWAVPLGIAYAIFATANLLLFPTITGLPPPITLPMYAVYVVAGLALSWGAVILLTKARAAA